jgi:hypothetical protein
MGLSYTRDNFLNQIDYALMVEDSPDPVDFFYRYRYVNAYDIERVYGGPEEGGWYYNWYTLLASIRVRNPKQALKALELLEDFHREDYDDDITLGSVMSNGDLGIYLEDDPNESETTEGMRYE